jgi:DNA-binding NtrC family response regulator
MNKFSTLIVDDEKMIRSGLKALLESEGYDVETARDGQEGLILFKKHQHSLVLSDINMPKMTGIDLAKQIKLLNSDTIIMLFTGYSAIENEVEAIKSGAEEYFLKPINTNDVLKRVALVYERHELKIKNERLSRKPEQIIGNSQGIRKVKKVIKQVSKSDIPMLITGETGTGKELIAHSIHDQSPWRNQPFVTIDCASMPPNLLESELFGPERSVFTGAAVHQHGLFELANKGTLLLGEIDAMSSGIQSKILRAIESKQFQRLGIQKETSSDFRVITTTNQNPLTLVKEGKFRKDLFYQLNLFIIEVPALRRRKSDIPLLVDYFSVRKGRQDPKSNKDSEFIQALQSYNWPGNILELQNVLERVFLLAGRQPPGIDHLPPLIQNINSQYKGKSIDTSETPTLAQIERDYILKIHQELDGNKTQAAKVLGISLRSLYNKLEKFEIQN